MARTKEKPATATNEKASHQRQATKRQVTEQNHSKAEPEPPENSKATTSRDYANKINVSQLQYCRDTQAIRNERQKEKGPYSLSNRNP